MRTILVTRDMVKVCALAWLAVGMLAFASLSARGAGYEEGTHYHTLPQAQPVQTGDNIEVLELFWYHCPHCFALEPFLEQWFADAKPENAEYIRMPGIYSKSTIFDARVFYTLEALGLTEKTHADIFQEIHVRKNPFKSLDDLRDFLKKHGINEVDFKDAFESFAVDTKLKQAQLMFERYQATGVPTIVVDGKYRATASSAGGHKELMELTNFLVEKAASERP